MKKFLIPFLVAFTITSAFAQETYTDQLCGYSINFPPGDAKLKVKKKKSLAYKSFRKIRFMVYKAVYKDYDLALDDLYAMDYLQAKEYKDGDLRYSNFYMVAKDAVGHACWYYNYWFFETNDKDCPVIGCNAMGVDRFPDLAEVYPFISSLRLKNGYQYKFTIIPEGNLAYRGKRLGNGFNKANKDKIPKDSGFEKKFLEGFNQSIQQSQNSSNTSNQNNSSQGYESIYNPGSGGTTGTVIQKKEDGNYGVKVKITCTACGGTGFVETAGITTKCGRCNGKGYIGK